MKSVLQDGKDKRIVVCETDQLITKRVTISNHDGIFIVNKTRDKQYNYTMEFTELINKKLSG